jgi:mono/diheme cytochrome c family protein
LFEFSCARCHTNGWSIFDPTKPPTALDGVNILGLAGGGGGTRSGIGFNLRDRDTIQRFGDDGSGGWQKQLDFVTMGSRPYLEYGSHGIGSGRMPGFGAMLTPKQIAEIVSYERNCLDSTTYKGVSPACPTPDVAPPTTSSTTTTAPG